MATKVGHRIRLLRKKYGYSADYLAEMLGVSRATMFRYESGHIDKLPSKILIDLSRILNTTPAYLLIGDDAEQKQTETNTEEDAALLQAYHAAPDMIQDAVWNILQAKRPTTLKKGELSS